MTEPRATFTAMAESTAEDWQVIAGQMRPHMAALPGRVLDHLRLLDGDYGGFAVDRLTHCLQTAARAERAGRSDDYVLCALLHDIGDTLGPYDHASIAAAMVRPFVPPELHWMVAHHAEFQGYFFFHHLGMDRDARERHRGAPEFDLTAEFCADFDQCSFDPAYPTPPLEHFAPLVEHVLGGRS
jgi:predicted HD phosphohydrolase